MFGDQGQNGVVNPAANPVEPPLPTLGPPAPALTINAIHTDHHKPEPALPPKPVAVPPPPPPPSPAPAPKKDEDDLLTEKDADGLLGIKQSALQQLSPLLSHLDQEPEERFRTIMMMIQAADDQSLIPQAYEAAQAIKDDKERAQALLDVINEVNYFTQQNNSSDAA